MKESNYMEIKFKALSENIKFARAVVSAFCLELDPTIADINDIKTAVSEAVTNAIIHGYKCDANKEVVICAKLDSKTLEIIVEDFGVGIEDIDKAQEPFYTTLSQEEHSGMGFTIMQSFMDDFSLESEVGKGTKVMMKKKFEKQKVITEA